MSSLKEFKNNNLPWIFTRNRLGLVPVFQEGVYETLPEIGVVFDFIPHAFREGVDAGGVVQLILGMSVGGLPIFGFEGFKPLGLGEFQKTFISWTPEVGCGPFIFRDLSAHIPLELGAVGIDRKVFVGAPYKVGNNSIVAYDVLQDIAAWESDPAKANLHS
jgi:hypothetical protein